MKLILQAIKALFRKVENAIPEKLPNPNPITFTGAVEATYDGNQAVEVEIPKGGGGYDVVIKHFWGRGDLGNEVILESGDFETLKNKFFNYECINALVYEIFFINGETIQETRSTRMVVFTFHDFDGGKICMWADPNNNTKQYYIHPDNTAEYWEYND
jgi:hypothetical protein